MHICAPVDIIICFFPEKVNRDFTRYFFCTNDHIVLFDICGALWYNSYGSIRRTDFGRCIRVYALMSCGASFCFFVPRKQLAVSGSFDHIFDYFAKWNIRNVWKIGVICTVWFTKSDYTG